MSRRLWILLGAVAIVIGVSIAGIRAVSSEPDYLTGLKPYIQYRRSTIMHNVRATLVGYTVVPPFSKYLRITDVQLKKITPQDAAEILKKTCSPESGWSIRTRLYNTFFTRGEASIGVTAPPRDIGPDSNVQDSNVTAVVFQMVPVSKSKERLILFLSRFGIRLAR